MCLRGTGLRHAGPFAPQSQVLSGRFYQLLAMNVYKMDPRTRKQLQEASRDNLIIEALRSRIPSLEPVSAKELKERAFQSVL
jgi:hypothetical protein